MDWTWLLIIVGLMFVMHRFGMGCHGGHGSHGRGGHGAHDHSEGKDEPSQRTIEAGEQKTAPAAVSIEVENKSGMGCCGGHQEQERGGGDTGKSSPSREVEAIEMKTADAVSVLAENGKQRM